MDMKKRKGKYIAFCKNYIFSVVNCLKNMKIIFNIIKMQIYTVCFVKQSSSKRPPRATQCNILAGLFVNIEKNVDKL